MRKSQLPLQAHKGEALCEIKDATAQDNGWKSVPVSCSSAAVVPVTWTVPQAECSMGPCRFLSTLGLAVREHLARYCYILVYSTLQYNTAGYMTTLYG